MFCVRHDAVERKEKEREADDADKNARRRLWLERRNDADRSEEKRKQMTQITDSAGKYRVVMVKTFQQNKYLHEMMKF